LTDDIVREAPAPNGLRRPFFGKEAATQNYRDLFQRFAADDRVVDDSIVTFRGSEAATSA
jgi:hypothetical protein